MTDRLHEAVRTPDRRRRRVIAAVLLTTIAAVLLLLAGLAALLLVDWRTPLEVTLRIDDSVYTVSTKAETVAALLAEEGVRVDRTTRLDPPAAAPLTDGMLVEVEHGRLITLTVDGMTSIFSTFLDAPQAILDSAGIALDPDDEVTVNGTRVSVALLPQFPLPANEITVRRALQITVDDAGTLQQVATTSSTVGDVLYEAGVTLYLGDSVEPALDEALSDGLTIRIDRSTPVTITVDGATLETRSQSATVGDALVDAGVTLAGLDYVIPPENANLRAGLQIRVVRVTEDVQAEPFAVPFETVYEASDALELDTRRVAQTGQDGVDQRVTRIRYEDGVEVRRIDEGIQRVTDPVNQIVQYGTNIVVRTVDTPDGPVEYWRKLRLYATSYHPAALGGDNVTATGKILKKGIVGIDPRLIPYGTRLYVPGYGYGEAADTGAPRRSQYWIDLGYEDDDWVSWSRNVDVYLVPPVPDRVIYLLP